MRDELLARRFRQKEIDADPVALRFVQSMSANLRPCNPNRGLLFESQSGGARCSPVPACLLPCRKKDFKNHGHHRAAGCRSGLERWAIGAAGHGLSAGMPGGTNRLFQTIRQLKGDESERSDKAHPQGGDSLCTDEPTLVESAGGKPANGMVRRRRASMKERTCLKVGLSRQGQIKAGPEAITHAS